MVENGHNKRIIINQVQDRRLTMVIMPDQKAIRVIRICTVIIVTLNKDLLILP